MERKLEIKDGQIVVKNPLYQGLPAHEVTIQFGKTLYRFTGSYDGIRSLPYKVLRLMEQSPIDEKDREQQIERAKKLLGLPLKLIKKRPNYSAL